MSILDTIVARKQREVANARERLPANVLQSLAADAPPPRDFHGALRSSTRKPPRIIAEVKRAAPSKGVLRPNDEWRPEALAQSYERAGAAALSVLTDVHYFWGQPDLLRFCRDATNLPALRKDFIIDPYQVDESRWLGADAILLIVRALDDTTLHACAERAADLGMAALVEIHADDELPRALSVPNAIIGINHRNLDTMTMDMQRAVRLRAQVPEERTLVAESGLATASDLQPLLDAGIDAFLIGSALASRDDPEAALRNLQSDS